MISRLLKITALMIFLFSAPAYAETGMVITKENALRESCRFFAPVVIKLKYKDTVEVLSKEGDWYKARFGENEGCIHKSAIEQKKFSLAGLGGSTGEASSDEVALAGKGFNPQVEKSYKGKHPELDFKKVDLIETYKVPEESLREFATSGGLNLP